VKEFYFGIPVIRVRNAQLSAASFIFFDIQLTDAFTKLVVSEHSFSNDQAAIVPAAGMLETSISTTISDAGAPTVLAFTAELDPLKTYLLRVEGWVNTTGVPLSGIGTDIHLGAISLGINAGMPMSPQIMSPISLDDNAQPGFRFELISYALLANTGQGIRVKMGLMLLLDSLFAIDSYSAQWGLYPELDVKVTGPDFPNGTGPTYLWWSSNGPIYPLANGTFTPLQLVGGSTSQNTADTLHLNLTAPAVITAQASVTSRVPYQEYEGGPETVGGVGITVYNLETRQLGSTTISVDPNSVVGIAEKSSGFATVNGKETYGFTCEVSPLSATEQGATITVLGVEVTQTVQQYHSPNSGPDTPVPLVAGKETLVRVYLDPGLSDPLGTEENVTGTLTIQVDGKTIPIDSTGPPMTVRNWQYHAQRRRLADTLNFVIPASFAHGSFSATITAGNGLATLAPFTSDLMVFNRPVHLDIIILRLSVDDVVLTTSEYLQVSNAITKIYPVATNPSLAIRYFTIPGRETLPLKHNLVGNGDVDHDKGEWDNLLDELEDIQEDYSSSHKLYAMLPNVQLAFSPQTGRYSLGGMARQGDNVAAGINVTDTTAHEIGHLYGLEHAPGGSPLPDGIDDSFVPSNGTIGEVAVDVESILSATDFTTIVFDIDTGDLMSYKKDKTTTIGNRWIGTYDFNKLLDSIE
jgi:hypothetical protein